MVVASHEVGDEGRIRRLVDALWASLLFNLAAAQQNAAVRPGRRLDLIMRDVQRAYRNELHPVFITLKHSKAFLTQPGGRPCELITPQSITWPTGASGSETAVGGGLAAV